MTKRPEYEAPLRRLKHRPVVVGFGPCGIIGDELVVQGESLARRLLNGRMLQGGSFSSHHDHRMLMALKVASLAADSPLVIDDEDCVSKSFPEFNQMFEQL